jgi:hypothetical protein
LETEITRKGGAWLLDIYLVASYKLYSVLVVKIVKRELTSPDLVVEAAIEPLRDGEPLFSGVLVGRSTSTSNEVSSEVVKPYKANTGTE